MKLKLSVADWFAIIGLALLAISIVLIPVCIGKLSNKWYGWLVFGAELAVIGYACAKEGLDDNNG